MKEEANMKKRTHSRWLATLLAVAMCLSMLPAGAWAAEEETQYIQVTDVSEITSGKYVLVDATNHAPTVLSGTWVSRAEVVPVDGIISDPAADLIWDITVDGSTTILTDSNGVSIAPKGASTNGIKNGSYAWTFTMVAGTVIFSGYEDTIRFSQNTASNSSGYRGYKTTTATGNQNQYPHQFTLYKLSEGETPPAPVKVATPSCAPASGSTVEPGSTVTLSCATEGVNYLKGDSPDSLVNFEGNTFLLPEEEGEYTIYVQAMAADLEPSEIVELHYTVKAKAPTQEVTIAEARAAENDAELIVTGTVIFIDGKNVVVQDSTGGINLYCSAAPTDLVPGDVVKGTGVRSEYNGLVQLKNATIEKTGTAELPEAVEVTIDKIGEDLESQRVKVVDAVVTAMDSNNVTLTQGESSIAIYKYPSVDKLSVGDTVTVTAVVSEFNKYQLRVNSAADIVITKDTEPDPEPSPDPEKPAIQDGTYVIYNPAYGKALSSNYGSSYYNPGTSVALTDNVLSGYGNADIWSIAYNVETKTYTISCSAGKLSMDTSFSSMPLNKANDQWILEDAGDGLFYVKNIGRSCYIEWYNEKNYWSGYGYIKDDTKGLFALSFYPAVPEAESLPVDPDVEEAIAAWGGPLKAYDNPKAVTFLYGDLFKSDDQLDTASRYTVSVGGSPAMVLAPSTGANHYMGGTGMKPGDYAQFQTSSKGWGDMEFSFRLRATSAAAGSWQLQYSTNGTDFSNFTTGSYSYAYYSYATKDNVSGSGSVTDGVALASKAPSQYITFNFDVPAGAENADTLYIRLVSGNVRADGNSDKAVNGTIRLDSVVLSGHPILSDDITGYVTVDPDGKEEDQPAGAELTMTSATEGATVYYRFNGNGEYLAYDEAAKPTLPELPANLEVYAAADGKAQSVKRVFTYAAGTVDAVRMTPNGGGIIFKDGEETKTVTLTCTTEGAAIYYAVGADEFKVYDPDKPITLNKGFGSVTIKAYATMDGFNDSAVVERTFTERATDRYQLFFGQLHSHTSYSDGAGTAREAFKHAYDNRDAYNIDFLAVTDHSNSFDNADTCDITDGSKSTEWVEGHRLAKDATTGDFVGLFGYEMTWSNGLGHMNTFNTAGFQSRTQADYSTYSTALQNYYAALKKAPTSISQFNHPGNTFGDFSDFAHYDEEIDQLITMIEVGNGEGAIGSSGYFPSYEYYTRALDKGWHVAPTNNQDNHKGGWGTANTGRDVVLVDELTEEAIYDAMRNYRMYATEDLNLSIYYTFDGQIMGTILDRESYSAGDKPTIRVELADPDDAGEATVQVIVNGGKVLAEKKATCDTTVEFSVPADYSYYYIKVTQADGDIAVTAPVWVGKVEAVGITSLSAASDLTVAGQEQSFSLELFNNEKKPLEITSIEFADDQGNLLHTATDVTTVPKLGTASTTFAHTFTTDGVVTITATVKGTLNGVEKVYTQSLELSVMPKAVVKRVIVDGTHYNDYVTGYYGGNINNASTIAASLGVEVVIEKNAITAEMLEDCELLVISAPARMTGSSVTYPPALFEDSFIDMVAEYVQKGGKVVICGLADYQDRSAPSADYHAAAQLNKLLEAMGSTMKINDDEVYDTQNNGGQLYRLYPITFNPSSSWTQGIVDGQTYSQYSGCTVDPGSGTWLVNGTETTYSVDSDKDGVGATDEVETDDTYGYKIVVPKGQVTFLAVEAVGQGTVFAAGGVFLSDFEVKAELDNIWDLPYANRTIFENMLAAVREDVTVTSIADTRKAELNKIFVVEGYVTNGTTDPNTTFFDAIYIQDETGGTTAFPYSAAGLAEGTKVRILGYTDAYQDDREIQIITLEVLDAPARKQEPKVLTTAQAMDYDTYGGQLLSTSGVVSEIVQANGVVSQFKLTDSSGAAATIFIDGYITNAKGENTLASWLRAGQTVSAVGLLYKHPEGNSDVSVPVFRVRNCDEIQLIRQPSGSGGGSARPNRPVSEVLNEGDIPLSGALPFEDVTAEDWFYTAVYTLYETGMMAGVDETHFAPHALLTRGMAVTILHRLEDSPAVQGISFPDVAPGQYYTDGVAWAAANGVVLGCDDGNYHPDDPVTREQMALILYRYAQFKGYEWKIPAPLDPFADAEAVSGYAREAMGWAVTNGLILGVGDNYLAPAATATRAEVSALLTRFLSLAYVPETDGK